MGQTSIILGNNTLNGVDTIKIADATDTSSKLDFVYGVTPTTTTSIKIGNTTLTGVNQVNVMGTDSSYKSFGYQPSGININICELQESGYAFYSLNDGADTYISRDNYIEYPWTFALIQSKSLSLSNVTKLEVGGNGTEINKVYIYNSSGQQIYNASLGNYTLVDITSNLVDGCYVAIQTAN